VVTWFLVTGLLNEARGCIPLITWREISAKYSWSPLSRMVFQGKIISVWDGGEFEIATFYYSSWWLTVILLLWCIKVQHVNGLKVIIRQYLYISQIMYLFSQNSLPGHTRFHNVIYKILEVWLMLEFIKIYKKMCKNL